MSFEKETLAKADEPFVKKGFDKKLVSLALLFITQVFIGTVCMTYRSCEDKGAGEQVSNKQRTPQRAYRRGAGGTATGEHNLIIIHITGSVRKPGWFTFEPGARVIDAVTRAGGVLPNTDFSDVNLARPLKDEEKLVFARKKRF